MLRLSLADLPSLLERDSEACVSIYLSRPDQGTVPEAFKAHYRALVKKAEAMLEANTRLQTKTRLLACLRAFGAFVVDKGHTLPPGVAFFASPSFLGWFPLPARTRGAVFVSNSFHIRPLLPYLNPLSRWFALTVSETSSSLFRCAAEAGELVAHCSTGADRLRTKSSAAQKLERWVCDRLVSSSALPLVITAPDDVRLHLEDVEALSTFRMPFVGVDAAVPGDPRTPSLLWPLVKAHMRENADRMLTELRKEYAIGRATTRPEDVVARLHESKLRVLALADEGLVRGRVDWRVGAMRRDPSVTGFGDCVLDDIAERALREKCRVIQTDATELPPGALLLAV